MNFKVNLIFLIKLFFLYDQTKKLWQKFKYLENIRSFKDAVKSIFHHNFFWRWEPDFKGKNGINFQSSFIQVIKWGTLGFSNVSIIQQSLSWTFLDLKSLVFLLSHLLDIFLYNHNLLKLWFLELIYIYEFWAYNIYFAICNQFNI